MPGWPTIYVEKGPGCYKKISSIGSGNGLNMYLSPWYMVRFPQKAKTPLERGVEKIVMYSAGVAYYIRRKGPGLLQKMRIFL